MSKSEAESNAEIIVNRALEAKRILEHPLFQEAESCVKADLFQQFCSSKWFQKRKRESVWAQMQVVEPLREYLEHVVDQGALGEHRLRKLRKAG